eukprot:4397604-Pyramimonas_sp.AAC.1
MLFYHTAARLRPTSTYYNLLQNSKSSESVDLTLDLQDQPDSPGPALDAPMGLHRACEDLEHPTILPSTELR